MKIFIFTFLLITTAQAQENGYIVNNTGDTLRGTIFNERFTSLQFRPIGLSQYQKIAAKEIKEYSYKDKLYTAQHLPYVNPPVLPKELAANPNKKPSTQKYQTDPTFLRVLENGSIKLFEYFEVTGTTGNSYIQKWYATKNDGPLLELKANMGGSSSRKERKVAFFSMIADNVVLANQFTEKSGFDHDRIQFFIQEYNKQPVRKSLDK